MVLHVDFTDGSNPWMSFPSDRHTIAKQWRRWIKYHPNTARPVAMTLTGWQCRPVSGGGYAVGRYFDGAHKTYFYKHLGHALAALERLGGDRP